MIVNYSTFNGTSFTSDIYDFKGLITDIRKQLDLDAESTIAIACKGKVYREPHASLEQLLSQGSPILIRYNLSKEGLAKRREDRNKIRATRKDSNSIPELSIMDDCHATPQSIQDNPLFQRIFNSGRHNDILINRSVTVEDELENEQDNGVNEERKEQQDIIYTFVTEFAINRVRPNITQPLIHAIAESFSLHDAPWNFYRGAFGREPAVENFISNIRRNIPILREFISTNYPISPDLIIGMITSQIMHSDDREEHIDVSESNSDVSDAESDDEVPHIIQRHRIMADPLHRERSLSPTERTTINIICDMMNVGPELAESAFRQGNYDQSQAVDILMNQDNIAHVSPPRNPIRRSPPRAPLRNRAPNLSERLQSQYRESQGPASAAPGIINRSFHDID